MRFDDTKWSEALAELSQYKVFENQTILHNDEIIVKDICDIGDKYVAIIDDKEVEVFVYSASTWSTIDYDAE